MLRSIAVVTAGLVVELCVVIIIVLRTRDPLQLTEAIGTLLVVLGVGAELAVEFAVHIKEKRLRKVNDKIESGYRDTLTAAADKIAELKEEMAYRTIPESLQSLIADDLRPFAGQKICFMSTRHKKELSSFSSVLLNVFLRSQWQVVGATLPAFFPLPQDGMILVIHPNASGQTKGAAHRLMTSLLKAEHEILGPFEWLNTAYDTDLIVIALGTKP